jgi:magnesium transporter
VDLLKVLPHEDTEELLDLLPDPRRERVNALLSEREVTAMDFISLTANPSLKVSQAKTRVVASGLDYHKISYLYVVDPDVNSLMGVVDAHQLLLEQEIATMEEIMTSPAVAADSDDIREDLATLFSKYNYRMIPVVDPEDRILGVINYHDIMTSTGPRP